MVLTESSPGPERWVMPLPSCSISPPPHPPTHPPPRTAEGVDMELGGASERGHHEGAAGVAPGTRNRGAGARVSPGSVAHAGRWRRWRPRNAGSQGRGRQKPAASSQGPGERGPAGRRTVKQRLFSSIGTSRPKPCAAPPAVLAKAKREPDCHRCQAVRKPLSPPGGWGQQGGLAGSRELTPTQR